jgi:hypothetical protein
VTVDDKGVAGGEILFDDDARLSAEERQRSGEAVTKPVKQADGSLLVQPVLTIDKKRLPAM